MLYNDLLRMARETLGLAIKGRPKKAELEAMVASAQAERATNNDPADLRERAADSRRQGAELVVRAEADERRAMKIEGARTAVERAEGELYNALFLYREAVGLFAELGIDFTWPAPLSDKVVDAAISVLTLPLRIYVFWIEGHHPVARGYVSAESFETAKQRWGARDVDSGASHPGSCGWPAAVERCLIRLQENGNVVDEQYSSVLWTQTLTVGHLYEFRLGGSEYAGRGIVAADTFAEAKSKALAGDILEGDTPDPEIIAELREALNELQENGQVVREDHTLSARTIC